MPDEVKLLPCPFCAGPGRVESSPVSTLSWPMWKHTPACPLNAAKMYPNRKAAAEAWNTRAIEATRPTDEVVERVARAICWADTEEGADCSSKCLSANKCMADPVSSCFIRDARAAIAAQQVNHD